MSRQRKLIILSHQEFSFPLDPGFQNVNDAYNQMIESLLAHPFGKDLQILLITDFWQLNEHLKSEVQGYVAGKIEEENVRNFNTVLFCIRTLNGHSSPDIECVRSFGSVNIGNYDTLAMILTYINDNYQSQESILMTWDHGYGFGIFHNQPNKESITDPKSLIHTNHMLLEALGKDTHSFSFQESGRFIEEMPAEVKSRSKKRKRFFEVSNLNRTDMLTYNELALAIQRAFTGFNGKKLDLLIFMNCNMMLIDGLYTLSNGVKQVMGAESPISWLGYDYQVLIEKLADSRNTLDTVVDSIFQSFESKHASGKEEDMKWEVISAFNLEKVNEMLVVFNRLTLLLIQHIVTVFNGICTYLTPLDENDLSFYHDRDVSNLILTKKDGVVSKEFYNLCLFDCIDLLVSIKESLTTEAEDPVMKEICDLITQFSTLVADSRRALFVGFQDKVNNLFSHNLIRQFSGISIFFPRNLNTLKDSLFYDYFYSASGVFTSILSQQSFWNEFILVYCKYEALKNFRPPSKKRIPS